MCFLFGRLVCRNLSALSNLRNVMFLISVENGDIPLATVTCSGSYYIGYQFSDIQIRQNCTEADNITSVVTEDLEYLLEVRIIVVLTLLHYALLYSAVT